MLGFDKNQLYQYEERHGKILSQSYLIPVDLETIR